MLAESNASETLIHATTWEDINSLLEDGYKVDNYRLPSQKNKPSAIVGTDQPLYKEVWSWNGIDHKIEALYW